MGPIQAAVADGVITFLWVFCVSTLGAFTSVIAAYLNTTSLPVSLLITTSLVAFLVFIFSIIGDAVGGASFNPTGTAAFYAAGLSKDSLISMALRFPAQAAGAVGGALAILEYMPPKYKHMLGGPSLKVDLHTGAAAEGILTFVITMAVLWIVVKGPANSIVKTWMLAVATVAMVITGSGFTGPSMNPANEEGIFLSSSVSSCSFQGQYTLHPWVLSEVTQPWRKFGFLPLYMSLTLGIWLGVCEQPPQHMGAVLRILDLPFRWRDPGWLVF